MALTPRRHRFGGSSADTTQSFGTDNAAIFEPGVTLWVWQSGSGGSRLTDLEDENNDPISEITSSATASIPVFYGPVDVAEVWVAEENDSTGPRALLAASDLKLDINTLDAALENVSVEAGIQTINTLLPDGTGELALAPDGLVPPAAEASDVQELQERVAIARVVQVGAGYPPRPSYADYVDWVGTLDPGSASVDGDFWDFPSAGSV